MTGASIVLALFALYLDQVRCLPIACLSLPSDSISFQILPKSEGMRQPFYFPFSVPFRKCFPSREEGEEHVGLSPLPFFCFSMTRSIVAVAHLPSSPSVPCPLPRRGRGRCRRACTRAVGGAQAGAGATDRRGLIQALRWAPAALGSERRLLPPQRGRVLWLARSQRCRKGRFSPLSRRLPCVASLRRCVVPCCR